MGSAPSWSARCRRSIWCWSKATSATPSPSSKSTAPPTASRCCIPTTRISSPSPPTARCRRATVPVIDLDDIEAIADMLLAQPCRVDAARRMRSALMAQLTDDCFAFSGPLLRLDDMERLIGERVAPVAGTETRAACGGARGRVLARRRDRAGRSAAVRQFRGRRLRGAPRRSRSRTATRGSPIAGRLTAGARAGSRDQAGRGGPHFHRRADAGRAPTPCSCRRT